ncbi:MAG: hypothetical protein GY856_29345 [bacterium]|nr:hypothetical protein [bacterium]
MPATTVQLLPLSPAPFSVHLVLAEKGSDGEVFVRVGGESSGARSYLALLMSETGVVLDRLVLKLPVESAAVHFPGEEVASHAVVEAKWAAAREDLRKLREAPRYFPLLVLPSAAENAAVPPRLPPSFFCPVAERFFPVPCPACLRPLSSCRDDALLAQARLPLYSATTSRFLHCPACLSRGEAPRFFIGAPGVPPEGDKWGVAGELAEKGVGGIDTLRAQLAATLERLAAKGAPPGGEIRLPCVTCPQVGPCLGAGLKGKRAKAGAARWIVFNFYDSPYLLTRLAAVPFDRFVELLGGRPGESDQPAGPGYLFAAEGSGIDAVEVLALKLVLFLQLVRALREYYRLLGLPHLDLHPAHIAVEPGSQGDQLPHLWSFQVKLLGTSSSRLQRLGSGVEVVLPPREPQVPFCSPALRDSCLIQPRTAELVLDRLVPEKGEAGRFRLVGKLADPNGIFPPPSACDRLRLSWPRDLLGAPERSAVARPDPQDSGAGSAALSITTEPLALGELSAQQVGQVRGLRIPDVRYRIYPALGVAEDVYSLGVLLLRTLLVNDRQDLGALEEVVAAIGARNRTDSVEAALASVLAEHSGVLAESNVFFQEADRVAGRPNSIPDELWRETLLFAFRLIARGPGLGLPDEGASDAVHLEAVFKSAEDLLRRLNNILFQRQAVHMEIHSVIGELLAEEET